MPMQAGRRKGVRIVRHDQLDPNLQSWPGMELGAAISRDSVGADRIWAGSVTIHPGGTTGPHHHGELESVIYVVSGRARFRWGERLEHAAEAGPGDFVYVPAFAPHQEMNASEDEPLVCILVRNDPDPVVVQLDIEPAEAPGRISRIDRHHPARRRAG